MSDKTAVITVIVVIFLGTLMIMGLRISGGEDNWICQNGQWVKHGNPSSPAPTAECSKANQSQLEAQRNVDWSSGVDANVEPSENQEKDIEIENPLPDSTVGSPFEITGEAKGNWFFEGEFPVKLVDDSGKIIAESNAKALGDWMSEDLVPFWAIFEFSSGTAKNGTLIFSKNNPSGMSENASEIRVPVNFGESSNVKIKLYYGNLQFDPESSNCEKTYEVERVIPKTVTPARAALEQLIAGPTDLEKSGAYITNINPDVKIQKLTISAGTAGADFSKEIKEEISEPCRLSAIKSQITETLKQFPNVKNVVISVDGETGALEP